jgi:hypothetical protein
MPDAASVVAARCQWLSHPQGSSHKPVNVGSRWVNGLRNGLSVLPHDTIDTIDTARHETWKAHTPQTYKTRRAQIYFVARSQIHSASLQCALLNALLCYFLRTSYRDRMFVGRIGSIRGVLSTRLPNAGTIALPPSDN